MKSLIEKVMSVKLDTGEAAQEPQFWDVNSGMNEWMKERRGVFSSLYSKGFPPSLQSEMAQSREGCTVGGF